MKTIICYTFAAKPMEVEFGDELTAMLDLIHVLLENEVTFSVKYKEA